MTLFQDTVSLVQENPEGVIAGMAFVFLGVGIAHQNTNLYGRRYAPKKPQHERKKKKAKK